MYGFENEQMKFKITVQDQRHNMKVLIQYVANGMAWNWANEIQDQSSGSESQNRTADPVCGQSYGLTKNQSNYSTVVYKANFGGIASECCRPLTSQD